MAAKQDGWTDGKKAWMQDRKLPIRKGRMKTI